MTEFDDKINTIKSLAEELATNVQHVEMMATDQKQQLIDLTDEVARLQQQGVDTSVLDPIIASLVDTAQTLERVAPLPLPAGSQDAMPEPSFGGPEDQPVPVPEPDPATPGNETPPDSTPEPPSAAEPVDDFLPQAS